MRRYKSRKGINLLTIFLVIDLLAVFATFKTGGAVYHAEAVGTTDARIAFYALNTDGIIEEGTTEKQINLGDIAPKEYENNDNTNPNQNTKTYKILVYNTNNPDKNAGNLKIADGTISYELKIITTTNLPLEYKLYYNQSNYSSNASDLIFDGTVNKIIHKDEWGTDFMTISVPEKCLTHNKALYDYYYLTITFPEEYTDPKYQDIIESIKLQITTKQLLATEISERNLVCRE